MGPERGRGPLQITQVDVEAAWSELTGILSKVNSDKGLRRATNTDITAKTNVCRPLEMFRHSSLLKAQEEEPTAATLCPVCL